MAFPALSSAGRGDVIAAKDGRFGLVLYTERSTPVMALITANNSNRLRSDVSIDDLADMAAMGCAGRSLKIRTATRVSFAGICVGRAPEPLMLTVLRTATRAIEAAQHESKYSLGSMTSMV